MFIYHVCIVSIIGIIIQFYNFYYNYRKSVQSERNVQVLSRKI